MRLNSKKLGLGFGGIAVLIALFYVHALAGLASTPVTFVQPPAFVDEYVLQKYGPEGLTVQPDIKLTKDYFNEAALVRNVIVNGESPEELIGLLTHPNKETRVKAAFAFGEVNIKLSHDEGTGFDEKRKQFWLEVAPHSDAIQNALFEALIASAQENSWNYIPYTLAWWMQEQKSKAVDMLAWAAIHHPDTWVRNFSIYYVVQFGENEERAAELLSDRTHDPIFRVRKQVLEQRNRRFKEMLFGTEEE